MKCLYCGARLTTYVTSSIDVQNQTLTFRYKKCKNCGVNYKTIEKVLSDSTKEDYDNRRKVD